MAATRSIERHGWWRREGGVREVLVVALPLVVSTLSWTIMNFIDRIFLFWYSADAMAAALPAGLVTFMLICFPLGLTSYANTFVSQYFGAKRYSRIGLAVWQAVWFGAIATPLAIAANVFAPLLFEGSGHPSAIAKLEIEYFTAMNYGGGAIVLAAALSAFFTGRGRTGTVMVVDTFGAIANCVLDYVWIFGVAGFPEMGLAGAAWATVAALWLKVAIYFALFLRPAYRRTFGTWSGCRFDSALCARMFWYGMPSGVQFSFEVGGFGMLILLIGRIGELELAATSLALNVNNLAFMPVLGLGIATATLVGQRQGEKRPDLASRSAWSAFWLATIYMTVLSAFYVLTPDLLFIAHRQSVPNGQDFSTLRDTTVVLLRFVAAYCVFDGMNVIFCSAIKGAGDTRFVLVTTIVTSLIPAAAGWIGITWFGGGLLFLWSVATAWVCLLGVIYMARFLQGRWRTMQVIEQEDGKRAADEPADEACIAVLEG